MLHQPLLSVCPEAACNESTLSSPSCASIRRQRSHSYLCLCWHYLKRRLHWICSTDTQEPQISSAVKFLCLATALAASTESCMSIHVYWERRASEPWLYSSLLAGAHQHNLIQISYKIWHLENESTSLNVSITIFSVSIALSMPPPFLYLFSSAVLYFSPTASLLYLWVIFTPSFPSLTLSLTLLPPLLLSAILLSVAESSQIYVSGHVWAELSQHHTQQGRAFYWQTECTEKKQLFCTSAFLPLSPAIHPLPFWHLFAPVLHRFPLTIHSHFTPENNPMVPMLSYSNRLF